MIAGRILSYDPTSGKGLLITQEKKKFPFSIECWEDFDHVPALNMLVELTVSGEEVTSLQAKTDHATPSPQPAPSVVAPQQPETPSAPPAQDVQQKYQELKEEIQTDVSDDKNEKTEEEEKLKPVEIELSYTIDECIEFYFAKIERVVRQNKEDLKNTRKVDFLRMRRFIGTAFNNLYELDPEIFDDTVQRQKQDLMAVFKLYQDFKSKSQYPKVAYDQVFLKRQEHYVRAKTDVEIKNTQISSLTTTEKGTREEVEMKEKAYYEMISGGRHTRESENLMDEVKDLKKKDVDMVHKIGELKDEVALIGRLAMEFRDRYYQPFSEIFTDYSEGYDLQLRQILDVKAYELDHMLWEKAKGSEMVKEFFKNAGIIDDFSSKTYLKYYVNSLDTTKMNEQNQKLLDLLKYMEKVSSKKVMLLLEDVNLIEKIKEALKKFGTDLEIKAFARSKDTTEWIKENPVDILILDLKTRSFDGFGYIDKFKKTKGKEEIYTSFYMVVDNPKKEEISEAGSMGVKGFLLKSAGDDEIVKKLHQIIQRG